jgi:hypothetical protein
MSTPAASTQQAQYGNLYTLTRTVDRTGTDTISFLIAPVSGRARKQRYGFRAGAIPCPRNRRAC